MGSEKIADVSPQVRMPWQRWMFSMLSWVNRNLFSICLPVLSQSASLITSPSWCVYGGPVGQGPAELSVGFWVPLLQKLLQGFRLGVSRFLVAIFPLGHCWPYSDRVALCMPLPSRCSGWTRWRSRDNFHNGLSGICGGCLHLSRGSAGDQKITECQRRARGRSGGRRHRLRSSLIFG